MTDVMSAQRHAPLPTPLTSFIGREREIQHLSDLLQRPEVRLVTLTGPGGVGKTRLAIRTAHDLKDTFADGVAFVSLAPITDPALLCPTIAQALGLRERSDRSPQALLAEALHPRQLLLVLDNVEQIVDAAPQLTGLLAACPELRILVTSRIRLRLSGEHEHPVRPLTLPASTARPDQTAEADAIRLFADRARAADSSFAMTAENARAVVAICQRLDGLPLALELVAAKVRVLPPQALLPHLAKTLPLLTNGRRDDPERHRTMRDAIAWSYNLLSPEDQALFHQLSVFIGGFTLESAVALVEEADKTSSAIAVLARLESLLEQSIIYRSEADPSRMVPSPRFGMLETVREFGLTRLEALGQTTDVRDAHAASFLHLAQTLEPELIGIHQLTALAQLTANLANLRAALAWLLERQQKTDALQLATLLSHYWFLRGSYGEGHAFLKAALASPEPVEPLILANALTAACELADWEGDYDQAVSYGDAAVSLWRELGDRRGLASALHTLGLTWVPLDPGQAEYLAQEILALAEALAVEDIALDAYEILAIAAYARGNYADAYAYELRCESAIRRSDDAALLARYLGDLGHIAVLAGQYEHGVGYLREALPLFHALESEYWLGGCLLCVALALTRSRPERAVRVFAAAQRLRADGAPMRPYVQAVYDVTLATARRNLSELVYETAWSEGQSMSAADAVAFAGDSLAENQHIPSPPEVSFGLTPREKEILKLMAAGHSNREIADALFISVPTVKRHVSTILGKLDMPSRPAAVAFAHTHDLA